MSDRVSAQTRAAIRPAEPVLGLRILAHPDLARVGALSAPLLEGLVSRGAPQFSDGPLATLHVSRTPVRVTPQPDGITLEASAHAKLSVEGSALIGSRKLPLAMLSAGIVLTLGRAVALWLGRFEPGSAPHLDGFVGYSAVAAALKRKLAQLAPQTGPVLLLGAPGTGKHAAARVLRALGTPAQGADSYIEELCALAPAELASIAHELEQARERSTPSRLIAGCAHDPPTRLRPRFADVLELPPLRKRPEDVAPLFVHFVREALERTGAAARFRATDREELFVPAALIPGLVRAPWPGNARQLREYAEAYVLANHAQPRIDPGRWLTALPKVRRARDLTVEDVRSALSSCHHDAERAAALLGVSKRSLVMRMRKLNVSSADRE